MGAGGGRVARAEVQMGVGVWAAQAWVQERGWHGRGCRSVGGTGAGINEGRGRGCRSRVTWA